MKQDEAALTMCKKIAGCLVKAFPTADKLYKQGSLEQNCAILHGWSPNIGWSVCGGRARVVTTAVR